MNSRTNIFTKANLIVRTWYKAAQYSRMQTNAAVIHDIQLTRLRNLLAYSYENIKYYRELFDSNSISPCQIRSLEDIRHIPILTKDQLRRRFWDMLPGHLPACRISRTSGSTGVPVCVLSDRNSRVHNSAAVIRYRKNLGIKFYAGTILTPLKNTDETFKSPHWTFLQGLHKTFYVNPYSSRENDLEYACRTIENLTRPAIIGITPAIEAMARRIQDNILPAIRPSAVLTSGQYLDGKTRNLLETTFGIEINDIYACNEAGDIAWQCSSGRYHINAENCIVELVSNGKPAKDGQIAEVIITNLNRYSMPFIRYKNGDLAISTSERCRCGCALPTVLEIVGRTGENIYLPNGAKVPWNQLKGFMNYGQIRQFQIVQNPDYSITIKYIPEADAHRQQLEQTLLWRFNSLLKNRLAINFAVVNDIPPAAGGKTKLVVSNIQAPKSVETHDGVCK